MDCDAIRRRFTPSRAFRAQRWIATHTIIRDEYSPVHIVAGLDVAYKRSPSGDIGIGVAVALASSTLKPIACEVVARRVCIPYVPGLLAFREMAVLGPALARLLKRVRVDIVIVDGHGIAHPRRAGIATHVGVVFDIPSIGVAKKRLYGIEKTIGGHKYLVDENGNPIAEIIERGRSRIYVSPGHRVSVRSSAQIIARMLRRGKLPEPTRIADRVSKEAKRSAPSPPCCDPVRIQLCDNNYHNTLS